MSPRPAPALGLLGLVLLLLGACAGRRPGADRSPEDETAFARASRAAATAAPHGPAGRRRGAAPGDERGPGRFVPRRDARTFYAATGGQLWYYLNLYYWAPEGADPKDLWIKAEVVEAMRGLRRWPDAAPAPAPAPKTTVEYWAVGASGRTMTIDNHKDFVLAADGWCAGAIEVTITLVPGRLRVRGGAGAWESPRTRYVVERRDFGAAVGVGEAGVRFEPLPAEPTTVWAYAIPWRTYPSKLVRSVWEGLPVPTLRLVDRIEPAAPTRAPVFTESR